MNLELLRNHDFPVIDDEYDATDTIRYALSVGVGLEPTQLRHLRYVYEQVPGGLAVLPTMASVLAYPGHWSRRPEFGLDWGRILHGEQRIVLHRPLRTASAVTARNRIISVEDKGRERGAVMTASRDIL